MVLFDTIYLKLYSCSGFFEIANQGYHFLWFFLQPIWKPRWVVIR